jgi:hypothetical protein
VHLLHIKLGFKAKFIRSLSPVLGEYGSYHQHNRHVREKDFCVLGACWTAIISTQKRCSTYDLEKTQLLFPSFCVLANKTFNSMRAWVHFEMTSRGLQNNGSGQWQNIVQHKALFVSTPNFFRDSFCSEPESGIKSIWAGRTTPPLNNYFNSTQHEMKFNSQHVEYRQAKSHLCPGILNFSFRNLNNCFIVIDLISILRDECHWQRKAFLHVSFFRFT